MRYSIVPYLIVVMYMKWSLADEPNHFVRTLQYQTCANVCEDTVELPSIQVQITEEEAVNEGFLGRIVDRFNGTFNRKSMLGRWMNGLFNLFRPLQQRKKPKYQISTDLLVSTLFNFSAKATSLAALLRNESDTYASASATPDIVSSIFEFSARNMEYVAAAIDPIVNDMRRNETIDLATVSCSISGLLTHLRDDTFSNVVSMAELLYTKTDISALEERYAKYSATNDETESLLQSSVTALQEAKQCSELDNAGTSTTTMAEQGGITFTPAQSSDTDAAAVLRAVILLVLLFPLSFIASFVTTIFAIFLIVFRVIFKRSFFPEDPDDDVVDGCNFFCLNDSTIRLIRIIGLIVSPILIPILIVLNMSYFIRLLFGSTENADNNKSKSPILSDDQITDNILKNVKLILDSPMQKMINTLNRISKKDEAAEAGLELDCDIRTIICQNEAMMESLPF